VENLIKDAHGALNGGQAVFTSVRPASTKDCTSGNETRAQNACASVPTYCIISVYCDCTMYSTVQYSYKGSL